MQWANKLFGYGLLDPELEKKLNPQQRQQLGQAAMMDSGLAMLAASGPSPYPTSLGQIVAQGMGAGRQAYGQQAQGLQAQMAAQAKAQQEAEFLQGLAPEQVRMAQIMGVGPFAAQQAQQANRMELERTRQAGKSESRTSLQKEAEQLYPGDSKAQAAWIKEQRAKPTGNVVNIGAENQFAKAMAGKDAEALAAWRDSAMSAGATLDQLGVLKQINTLQQGGKIGEASALVGQYFGSEAGANYQTFNAVQKNLVLEQAKALKGAMSDRDIALLEETLPRFGSDPRSNAVVIQILESAAKRSIQNYEGADAHAFQNGGLRGYKPLMRSAPSSMPVDAGRINLDEMSLEELMQLRSQAGGQ